MKYFGLIFLFFSVVLLIVSSHTGESTHGTHKEHSHHRNYLHKIERTKGNEVKSVKLPKILLRKFHEYSKSPENFTFVYHSIPVTIDRIQDDFFYLSAPYRKTKTTLLSVHLWIEFLDIKKSDEFHIDRFVIEITPIIGSREMTKYEDSCSLLTIVSNAAFPDDILELNFDISTLYRNCRVKDESPLLKYKISFYPFHNVTDINLARNTVYMFLLFEEEDDKSDIMSFLPGFRHIKPLHYENVIKHKKPHLRSSNLKKKAAKSCSLQPFTFVFEFSGWDHVVYPFEYKSNRCQGRCAFPLAPHLNYTNYAIVQAIGSTIYKEMKNPSCVAQDLAPLTMWVMDDDNKHTMKKQQNMIATSCKCC